MRLLTTMGGDLTDDSFNTYTWDVYGDMASVNGEPVTYDAFGRMVERNNAYEFVYMPSGGNRPLAWMAGQTLGNGYIVLPSGAWAVYNASGSLLQYNHADWMGSARLFSTPSRGAISAMAYAPFGEGYAGGASQFVQFAGSGDFTNPEYENDTGSLVDFMYRRYSPTQGRWISPDPAGLGAVSSPSRLIVCTLLRCPTRAFFRTCQLHLLIEQFRHFLAEFGGHKCSMLLGSLDVLIEGLQEVRSPLLCLLG